VGAKVETQASQAIEQRDDHAGGDKGQDLGSFRVGHASEPSPPIKHAHMDDPSLCCGKDTKTHRRHQPVLAGDVPHSVAIVILSACLAEIR